MRDGIFEADGTLPSFLAKMKESSFTDILVKAFPEGTTLGPHGSRSCEALKYRIEWH